MRVTSTMSGEPSPLPAPAPFRLCGSCMTEWPSWYDFVVDPEIRLLGLQAVPNVPDGNLLVFDHACGTSISLLVRRIRPFLEQEDVSHPEEPLGYEECRRHCPELKDLVACDRPCVKARDRAIVRAILLIMQDAQ
jgi:hypothetical protein